MGRDVPAVPENRHIVGNREDLIHLVGDVDDAHAMRLEVRDDRKEVLHFAFGERGSRLIHDQDVGLEGDGLGNLNDLPIGDGQVPDLDLRIEVNVQPAKQMLRHAAHLLMIHEIHESQSPHWLPPNPDVLCDRHVRHQVEFLMDHRDPRIEGSERRRQLHRFTLQSDLACVGLIDAGNDLHQGRFARTILAHEGVDGARDEFGADVHPTPQHLERSCALLPPPGDKALPQILRRPGFR